MSFGSVGWSRDLPPRQHTLRPTLDCSYRQTTLGAAAYRAGLDEGRSLDLPAVADYVCGTG